MILQFLLESCANQENYVWIYVHSNEIEQILFSGFLSMKLMQNENLINEIFMLNSLSFLFLMAVVSHDQWKFSFIWMLF